jgi:chromosome segregation ATPase
MEQTVGRTGITFEQVAAVADAIAARGDRPTLRGVRAELGSGSMGTIQKHLATWQGQRRQIVTSTATLPTEIQRVILSEIEREVDAARAELEAELAATNGDRDVLADDNEAQAEQIEQQTARLDEIEATSQQQAGRIAQLESDLETAWQATERERGVAEQARQALAKAELRLEALPKVEAEVERLRAALEASQARATTAEQLAAVTAEKLAGVEARLADALAREQQTAAKLAEMEKTAKAAAGQADEFRYRFMEADSKAREMEKEAKTAATRATAAEQRAGEAEQVAAELRGKLDALNGKML